MHAQRKRAADAGNAERQSQQAGRENPGHAPGTQYPSQQHGREQRRKPDMANGGRGLPEQQTDHRHMPQVNAGRSGGAHAPSPVHHNHNSGQPHDRARERVVLDGKRERQWLPLRHTRTQGRIAIQRKRGRIQRRTIHGSQPRQPG